MPEPQPAHKVRIRWPELMSTTTVAEYTDLSPRTIEKFTSTGVLRPVRLPNLSSVRFRRVDIDQVIAALPTNGDR